MRKVTSASDKEAQTELVENIGVRMRQAREMCNMSLVAAANRLGYSNGSKLSKVENASDTRSVPILLVFRASRLYDVSIDYLFGASNSWNVNGQMLKDRAVAAWMHEAWEISRKRDMSALKTLHDKVSAMDETINLMLASADNTAMALERFAELNIDFEDMRAGSRLVAAIENGASTAKQAKAKMAKFRFDCAPTAAEPEQLSLAV